MTSQRDPSPSTGRLDLVASPEALLSACRALSVIEAAWEDDPRVRWHVIEAGETDGDWVCRVSDGSGNEGLWWFGPEGTVLRGFDHESEMSPWAQEPMGLWPGLEDGLPDELRRAPALILAGVESVTFLIWRAASATGWSIGPVEIPEGLNADPDGSQYLLLPTSSPAEMTAFLGEYYERDVPSGVVDQLLAGTPLDDRLFDLIESDRNYADVIAEAHRIGYPT